MNDTTFSQTKLENNPHRDEILKCCILIVEDDPVGRAVLVRIFSKQGFSNIIEAENGKEGLEKARAHKPDLVITDIRMPVMDGYELCRALRGDGDRALSDVPILVQTALSDVTDRIEIYRAYATDYLNKPIDAHELMARSLSHLEQAVLVKKLNALMAKKH